MLKVNDKAPQLFRRKRDELLEVIAKLAKGLLTLARSQRSGKC